MGAKSTRLRVCARVQPSDDSPGDVINPIRGHPGLYGGLLDRPGPAIGKAEAKKRQMPILGRKFLQHRCKHLPAFWQAHDGRRGWPTEISGDGRDENRLGIWKERIDWKESIVERTSHEPAPPHPP